MKKNKLIAATLVMTFLCANVFANELSFSEKKHSHDVFKTQDESKVYFSYTYDSFSNWQSKLSGRFFNLEPAPVLRGLVEGVEAGPITELADPSEYEDQAAEFAEHTNFRAEGGRPAFKLKDGDDPKSLLEQRYKSTHVVEMTLSAVLDLPFENIDMNEEVAKDLAENIDYDHYHFKVPGSLVSLALEDSHAARRKTSNDREYLLSVFDMREYGCAIMKDGVDDYFSGRAEKDRLANGSIYLLSDIKFNNSKDMAMATKYFGKSPDALISQEALYADHLIRASKMYFAFFKEGEKTRVVLLSNLAMGSKFFTGSKGLLIRQYLLDGVGVTGKAAGAVKSAVSDPLGTLGGLFDDAEEDISKKNSCDSGLALGLIKYSQNLFSEFSSFVKSK